MNVILIVVQIVASIGLIGLILMQQGKGADAGASFGAGASQTFFGSAGSANAVTKLTAVFAVIFFAASLGLAYVAQENDRSGLEKELSEQLAPTVPDAADAVNTGLVPVVEGNSVEQNSVENNKVDVVNDGLAPESATPVLDEMPVSEEIPVSEELNEAMEKAALETKDAIDTAKEELMER